MKRGLAVFFASLALLLLGVAASSVTADGGDDNFKKAGLQVLAEKERLLTEKRNAVLATAAQIAADQTVDGNETRELKQGIEDFNQAKSEADNYLKFYELKTSGVLPEDLTSAVGKYWENVGLFARDRTGQVRTYLVRLTGHDVVVQSVFTPIGVWQIFLLLLSLATIAVSVSMFYTRKEQLIILAVALAFLAFISVLLLVFA